MYYIGHLPEIILVVNAGTLVFVYIGTGVCGGQHIILRAVERMKMRGPHRGFRRPTQENPIPAPWHHPREVLSLTSKHWDEHSGTPYYSFAESAGKHKCKLINKVIITDKAGGLGKI